MVGAILMAGDEPGLAVGSGSAEFGKEREVVLQPGWDEEERIIYLGRKDNRVMNHLDYLTNRIGPRLAGSENHQVASEWARDRFESFGLSNVHLEKCGEMPVGFDRDPASGTIRAPVARDLHFTTPAWSAGTDGKRRARAVMAPRAAEDLMKMRDDLDGAWVLRHPILDPVEYETYMEKWEELDVDIAGMLIPSRGEFLPSFGNHQIEWDNLPTIPQVILLESEWLEIEEMLSRGEEVVLEFDIRNYLKRGPVPLYNVVADIPGTEYPDEYVIIGAHLDSWDGATGANDNGTGVAATLEAARLIMESGIRPRRTVRFILFAGEEVGMVGSRGYVRDHPDLLPKISAVLVMDRGSDYVRGIMSTHAMARDFEEVFAPVMSLNEELPFEIKKVEHLPRAGECGVKPFHLDRLGDEGEVKQVTVQGSCGSGPIDVSQMAGCAIRKEVDTTGTPGERQIVMIGGSADMDSMMKVLGIPPGSGEKRVMMALGSSDFAPFLNAGVPGFMWDQSVEVPYWNYIHSQFDTYDTVVPEFMEHSSTVIALAAYGISNLDHMLSRDNLLEPVDAGTVVLEEN
jgi:hypothetical protein